MIRPLLVFCLLAALSLPGCGRKATENRNAGLAVTPPITTILDPKRAAAAPSLTRQPVRFADVTTAAGLGGWRYQNGATGRHLFVETTGGGVALFDYDNDGRLDLFALQGGPVPGAASAAERAFSTRSALYKNNGDGTFRDVTAGSGLEGNLGYGQAVSAADYDNDGYTDLYVTAYGGNHLLRNLQGTGRFADVTARAEVADTSASEPPWPLSAAWGDFDRDGFLDLFVCHYARWSPRSNRICLGVDGKPAYCRPQVFEPSACRLFRNRGNGTFADITRTSGIAGLRGKSMSAVWLDYNNDGWPDLFVTNDTMVNFLLANNGGRGTFTDRGIVAGVGLGGQGSPSSGMGVGAADYDGDGREDLFIVNFSSEVKSVYRSLPGGLFEDASYRSNVASTNLQFLGFGLECLDYDLDGWPDLVVGNGHVLDRMDAGTAGSSYAQSQQLFHNGGDGTFAEDLRSLGDLVRPRVTRGLAVGDVDNDGDPDVVMVDQRGPLQLFRNNGGSENNAWITLRLEGAGKGSNRDAVGARVTLVRATGTPRRQTQWVRSGSSYISRSDTRLIFGLGSAEGALSIEVRWPSGRRQRFAVGGASLPLRRFYFLREGGPLVPEPREGAQAPL